MKTDLNRTQRTNAICRMAVAILALAVCFGAPLFVAAQDQQSQSQAGDSAAPARSPDAAAPGGASDSTTPPAADAAPQAQAPAPDATTQTPGSQTQLPAPSSGGWHYNPGTQDQPPQAAPAPNSVPQDVPPAAPNGPAPQSQTLPAPAPQGPPPQAGAPAGVLPHVLTIPNGTVISVRLNQWLSSDQNHAGDTFSAEMDQPIVVDGWVVARRGQSVLGRVVLAQKSNHGNNESKLGLELAEITLVDGERLSVSTELVQDARARSQGRDAATVGTTTALGAIIGAAIGGGQGAAIGAGAGATAGLATVMSTSGRPTILRPEQLLTFRLQSPVDINTERGHVAFRPVQQADYARAQNPYPNAPPQLRYPTPPPYAAPYPAPYPYAPYAPYAPMAAYPAPPYYYGGAYCGGPTLWSCYPGPLYFSLGLWGGWGFGPRGVFFGGPGFRR